MWNYSRLFGLQCDAHFNSFHDLLCRIMIVSSSGDYCMVFMG